MRGLTSQDSGRKFNAFPWRFDGVEAIIGATWEGFSQWMVITNTGMAAKMCLDIGLALKDGASARVLLESILGV